MGTKFAKSLAFLLMGLVLIMTGAMSAQAVNVDIYSGHTTSGGGAPYSGLAGSFTSPDILFATNTGYNWHPFALSAFGADLTGCLIVEADATYTFTLNSDDGSLLFIDAALVVNNGGGHGPTIVSNSTFLAAGVHPFEVQFFEDFGGPSGVDLYLPAGVTYCPVPVPPSLVLMGSGLLGLVALRRRLLG